MINRSDYLAGRLSRGPNRVLRGFYLPKSLFFLSMDASSANRKRYLILRGGTCYPCDSTSTKWEDCTIVIDRRTGLIAEILLNAGTANNPSIDDADVVNAQGLFLCPGLIDSHVSTAK